MTIQKDIFNLPEKRPSVSDREYVRELGRRVHEAAVSERMAQIRRRWRDTNSLRRPDRAPVWCRPYGGWQEVLPGENLACTDEWLRRIETELKKTLMKIDIGDDEVVLDYWPVAARFEPCGGELWGVPVGRHAVAADRGAWAYDPPIRTRDDLEKIRVPQFEYNRRATDAEFEKCSTLFDGVMPVRIVAAPPLSTILGHFAADLLGLSELMLQMAMDPEMVHAAMRKITDGVANGIDAVERSGMLTLNNVGPMIESDPVGVPAADGTVTAKNLWSMSNSQEYDQVSPAMWEEFGLDYQKRLFGRFGLISYGCCENLTKKIDGVLSIPNLRIFVVSAWTNLDLVLERTSREHVIMWRQKATDVMFPESTAGIAAALDEGARKLKGRNHQIVLREIETFAGHPARLHEWTRLAIEAAERWA